MKYKLHNSFFCLIFILLVCHNGTAQSLDEEKVATTNFIKRMYQASPFEGGKLVEGEEASYHVVAIPVPSSVSKENEKKAQETAASSFAEPFIKFELIGQMQSHSRLLYYCIPLSKFVKQNYLKEPFDGARIVTSPNNNFLITVVSLDPAKYTNPSLMDRVAQMKSNQQSNAINNGSTITSDIIISTEQNGKETKTNSLEVIREQTMGFIQGLSSLIKFDYNNKKVFIYYQQLKSN
ncbi:hypothetical protein VR610_10355 [Aquirufa regiilacus]